MIKWKHGGAQLIVGHAVVHLPALYGEVACRMRSEVSVHTCLPDLDVLLQAMKIPTEVVKIVVYSD